MYLRLIKIEKKKLEESEQVSQEELLYIYIYIHPEKLAGGVKEDFVNFSFSRGQCEFFKWHFTSW